MSNHLTLKILDNLCLNSFCKHRLGDHTMCGTCSKCRCLEYKFSGDITQKNFTMKRRLSVNNDLKTKLEEIYTACNDERVFEIQKRIGDLLREMQS